MPSTFFSSPAQPHPERTKAILRLHPDVRDLMGRNPWTAPVLLAVVFFQVAIAWSMGRLGLGYWWLALIVAYLMGAFANNCLYVIIHEATHNLIFENRKLNKLAAIVADLPNVLPAAIGFSICHLEHHAHQGEYERDADVPSHWEANLVGNRWYAKAIWLFLFPLLQLLRPGRLNAIPVLNRWTILSVAAALAFDTAIVVLCGWNGLVYLSASVLFALGLHPLGARWIQEHYTLSVEQETFSYYGPLNLLTLNVGYHNEHHDFPSIPWNRLPQLRAKAPEFYDSLESKQSLTTLLLQFIFDPRYSLHSRVIRENAGRGYART